MPGALVTDWPLTWPKSIGGSMSVKPYPAGTQVVITWNGGSDKPRLGEVHTLGIVTGKPAL